MSTIYNTLDITGLVPMDVIQNSGTEIPLFGTLTGAHNEVIVITQLRRAVYDAWVCHTEQREDKLYHRNAQCVIDMPGFNEILITNKCRVKDGKRYIMACLAEKDYNQCRNNWLY